MRKDLGTFTVKWREGTDVFPLEKCYMRIIRGDRSDELFVYARGATGTVRAGASEADLDFPIRLSPNAEVLFSVERLDSDNLVRQTFVLPVEYDEQQGEHRATVYLGEHEDLNDNEVKVLERDGDYFRLRWTGNAADQGFDSNTGRYYDVPIVIEGWFTVEQKKRP